MRLPWKTKGENGKEYEEISSLIEEAMSHNTRAGELLSDMYYIRTGHILGDRIRAARKKKNDELRATH